MLLHTAYVSKMLLTSFLNALVGGPMKAVVARLVRDSDELSDGHRSRSR